MERELKAGDWARLRTGGAVMTIFEINEAGAHCRWLEGRHMAEATFPLSELERSIANDAPSSPEHPSQDASINDHR